MANNTGKKYGGRSSGVPNKLTNDVRLMFNELLNENFDKLKEDFKLKKDEIEKLAEEYGVDPAFAKKLSDSITSKIKSPISEEELEMLRETKLEKEQDSKFDKEFNELLEVNPEAKEHKKKLKELAFNPKYSGKNFKPLYYIFGKEIQANAVTKTKTAEPS
jgi:Glu-tRNA(Gln) amidotransferase subunit E-like FAD-binding protein